MTDPRAHPDTETLAAFAAGDLAVGDVADGAVSVSRHLTGCDECAADLAAIERATSALAALPPVTMPLDVITAVERAIEAERRGTVPASSAEPAPASLADARRRRRPSFAPFAAAAAVVGLATAVGLGALRGGTPDNDTTATADSAGGSALSAAAPLQLQSGTDYTQDTLADQVRSTLSGSATAAMEAAPGAGAGTDDYDAPVGSAGGGTTSFDAGARSAKSAPLDPAALESCVQELSGGSGAVPVLIDSATYAGQPAVVVVLPFRADKLDVFVVRPDCRLGNDALLYFQRIDA